MPRPPFPQSVSEFQAWFATDEACLRYLIDCRWPEGYCCPRCAHDQAYERPPGRCWSAGAAATRLRLRPVRCCMARACR